MNTPLNAEVVRAVVLTACLCGIAAFIVLHRNERRHEREIRQSDAYWRKALVQQHTRPPLLTEREQAAFDEIAARWDDSGLDILDGEGEQT